MRALNVRCYFVTNLLLNWQLVELTEKWFGVDVLCRRAQACNYVASMSCFIKFITY